MENEGLNLYGWLAMILSVGSITLLNVFCFYRVLTGKGSEEHLHAPLDIDTHDRDT